MRLSESMLQFLRLLKIIQWFLTLPKLYRRECCCKIFGSLPFKGERKGLENKWTEFIQLLNYLCHDSLECLYIYTHASHYKFIIYYEEAIGCEF